MADLEDLEPRAAVELVQAKLLAGLFTNTLRHEIALKGGMAMRVAGGSVRHTKDIDLASPDTIPAVRVRTKIRAAVAAVKASGLMQDFVVSEPKQTDTTLRWKIGGRIGATIVNLTVEVSRRPGMPIDHVTTATWTPPANTGLPPILIDTIDMEALAAAKIACLGDAKREAPRDTYDLHFLITMNVKPPIELLRRMGREKLESFRQALWSKLEKMTFKEAQTSLLPSLPDNLRSRMTERVWDDMCIHVGEVAGEWIDAALSDDGDGGGEPPKPR